MHFLGPSSIESFYNQGVDTLCLFLKNKSFLGPSSIESFYNQGDDVIYFLTDIF
jgi:hypothetical protein